MASAVLVGVLAVAAASLRKPDVPPAAAVEEKLAPMVTRAVFAGGRLWLLHADGSLVSMLPEAGEPEPVEGAGKVADICWLGGRLLVVAQNSADRWLLQARTASAWGGAFVVPTGGEELVAFNCDHGRITLVTSRRLIEVVGGRPRSTYLSEPFRNADEGPPAISTAHVDDKSVWVGFNLGEWGGGLLRIARATGRVEWLERNRSGKLCGGPLNRDCDPVNGIVASPGRPSCVVAAIGLAHMMSHGRIIRICGKDVQRLYFKPLDPQPPNLILDGGEPPSTVAFYGLANSGHTLWSVGIDGLYRLIGDRVEFRPLPQFQNRGRYLVSFDIAGVVLVMTGSNQRTAMSGSIPIMAVH